MKKVCLMPLQQQNKTKNKWVKLSGNIHHNSVVNVKFQYVRTVFQNTSNKEKTTNLTFRII